jgi:hypothetical protein
MSRRSPTPTAPPSYPIPLDDAFVAPHREIR